MVWMLYALLVLSGWIFHILAFPYMEQPQTCDGIKDEIQSSERNKTHAINGDVLYYRRYL